MNKTRCLLPFAALCAFPLPAQEPSEVTMEVAMPSPKTAHHAPLAAFVGSWDNVCTMPPMPGTDEPMELVGTEHAELICDGLFVKSIVNGSYMGQPFQGLWITGYDNFNEQYHSLWVDVMEPSVAPGTDTYDAATRTWTFRGESSQGVVRSVVTFDDADNFHEVNYVTPPGGEESVMMEITRERAKKSVADAAAFEIADPTGEQEELLKMVGDWDATLRMKMGPDAPWTEEKCAETVTAIIGGKWLWTDFSGQMMGMPFEGHMLMGYDTAKDEYVSYWMDTWSPVPLASSGTWDEDAEALKMAGKGVDMMGRPFSSTEVVSWKDDDTRVLEMKFETGDGPQSMEIVYKRVK